MERRRWAGGTKPPQRDEATRSQVIENYQEMDAHGQIVSKSSVRARVSGDSIVIEVIRLHLALISALVGADMRLRQFVELASAARVSGSEDQMAEARVALWAEIERMEGNSVTIACRESAVLRALLPFPEPGDPNDDELAWASEMISAAGSLPSRQRVETDT